MKVVRLTVRNTGERPRRLAAAFYAEWVLAASHSLNFVGLLKKN